AAIAQEQGLGQESPFSDELLRRVAARVALRASPDFAAKLPAATRALFPAAFELCDDPALGLGGWVPKGWKPSNVGLEFDVTMGQSPPGSTYNEIGEGMPFFQGKTDFGFRFPCNRIYCTEPKRMARKNDTLVSVRAPVGDINLAAEDCAIGRGIAAARHKSDSISFSYYAMNNLSTHFKVFEGEGTVFGSINQKDFKDLPLIKYPAQVVSKFDEFCGCWDKRIENIAIEVTALTNLRDTLLPKLISGELRLDDLDTDLATGEAT
ncbi:MAG: restriction endonuclease subunit S, partial [Enterovibrio sp.]